MKTKTQKTFLGVLAMFIALCLTFAFSTLTARAENMTIDPTAEKTYTEAAYSVVADVATDKRIDVPVKWDEIQDKTNVTATITAKGVDFMPYTNDYSNDPYIIIRETEDKSFQVWARVIRNGVLQVFTGKIGVTENVPINVNAWAQHTTILGSWSLKIVTTATSAEFFVGETSYGTVNYDATPLAFGIDFCAGFYGYMTDLSLKIEDKEYVDINDETEIEGFTVSDLFIPASSDSVTLPTIIGKGKYVKNVKTGKYEKTSDLEVEMKFTAVDTGETIGDAWWNVPIIGFYTTEGGASIGVRNGSNGITQIFRGSSEGSPVYSSAYHGYYDVKEDGSKKYNFPYAYGVKVNIKNGIANVALAGTVYHSDVELGAGKAEFVFGNNGATAFCGISVKVKNAGDYDFNDIVDAQYLGFIDAEPTEGKLGYFDVENGSYSAPDGVGGYDKQVALSSAFGGENLSATKLNLVMSYTVTMDSAPANVWEVPGVTFWQGADGATYNLLAHYNANTYVFKITGNGTQETPAKQFGACALSAAHNGTYSVTIKIENGAAKFAIKGHQNISGEFELPEGKPVMNLFTRGTAATFSDVKFYTTDIDFAEETGTKVYSESMAVTEAPTAQKFGDELVGGKLKITLSDKTEKEIALTDAGVTVTYNPELLGEQDVIIKYEDATAVFKATVTVNLVDYATRIVLDTQKEEFEYGEDLGGYTVTAIMASGAETDVTADVTVGGYDKNKSGVQEVTFTYGALTVKGEFTVKAKPEPDPSESDSGTESGESGSTGSEEASTSGSTLENSATAGGCFGGIGSVGMTALVVIGGAIMFVRKKKEN